MKCVLLKHDFGRLISMDNKMNMVLGFPFPWTENLIHGEKIQQINDLAYKSETWQNSKLNRGSMAISCIISEVVLKGRVNQSTGKNVAIFQ